jgi:hypothetical protein
MRVERIFDEDPDEPPPDDCSLPSDLPPDDDTFIIDDDDEPSEPPPSSDDDENENDLGEPPPDDDDENFVEIIEKTLSQNEKNLKEISSSQTNTTSLLSNSFLTSESISSLSLSEQPMVSLQDHPDYSKYLKMIKVGLPLVVIRQKIQKDGYDPKYLDSPPDTLIPLARPPPLLPVNGTGIGGGGMGGSGGGMEQREKKGILFKPKKRIIHWKEICEEDVDGEDNVWGTGCQKSEINAEEMRDAVDQEEIFKLFVFKSVSHTTLSSLTFSRCLCLCLSLCLPVPLPVSLAVP